jgi:threonine dehydrogenase-like Zn-dependent dehydrogenase
MFEYRLYEPHKICRVERDIPEPGPGEALIRVRNVGICGSDIHLFNGTYNAPHQYPLLFGHEWSGVVEKTGRGLTKAGKGDVVTGDCSKYCGTCENCSGDKNLCEHIQKFGITVDGASAEYIVRDEKYLYPAPEGMDPGLVCLSEPVAVAVNLIGKIKQIGGDLSQKRILVFGGGLIGMAAMMFLKHMEGCKKIELFDLSKYRTGIAASSGARIPEAQETEAEDDGTYAKMYRTAKYDVVIETTGAAPVFAKALYLVKPAGILGCAGMIARVQIAQKLIVTKSLVIVGSIGGTGHFDRAMDFIRRYPKEAGKLISHHYPISDAEAAFKTAMRPDEAMKVVFDI